MEFHHNLHSILVTSSRDSYYVSEMLFLRISVRDTTLWRTTLRLTLKIETSLFVYITLSWNKPLSKTTKHNPREIYRYSETFYLMKKVKTTPGMSVLRKSPLKYFTRSSDFRREDERTVWDNCYITDLWDFYIFSKQRNTFVEWAHSIMNNLVVEVISCSGVRWCVMLNHS